MATHCPECGAPQVDGLDCWDQLGGIIAWEAHDPELLQVHFLTVASWNLQHPARFMPGQSAKDDSASTVSQTYVRSGIAKILVNARRNRSTKFDIVRISEGRNGPVESR